MTQTQQNNGTIKTVACEWVQFSVWARIGCGDDKRKVAVLWANDAYHAAHLARTRFGQSRYQVRDQAGRKILLSYC